MIRRGGVRRVGRGRARNIRQQPPNRQKQQNNENGLGNHNPPQLQQNSHVNNTREFRWEQYDFIDPYVPDWLPRHNAPRGVLVDTSDYSLVDYFKLFFPDEVFDLISNETNRYAA